MSKEWRMEDDEYLINFVKKNEVLYNVKHHFHDNRPLKRCLWSEVGNALNRSGDDCSRRWTYVRDYYRKSKLKSGIDFGMETSSKRSHLLSFLDFFETAKRRSSLQLNNFKTEPTTPKPFAKIALLQNVRGQSKKPQEQIVEGCFQEPPTKLQATNNTNQPTQQQKNNLDETDHFFMSMSNITKKLPPYERAALRMQIATIVGNAELRLLEKTSRR